MGARWRWCRVLERHGFGAEMWSSREPGLTVGSGGGVCWDGSPESGGVPVVGGVCVWVMLPLHWAGESRVGVEHPVHSSGVG